MESIGSKNNKTVKLIKKLKDKKHRDAEGVYVIEGPNLLEEAVKNQEDIRFIGIKASSTNVDTYKSLIPEAFEKKTALVEDEIFEGITDTVTPQDVIALVTKRQNDITGGHNRFILLDELQDPGNVGTIIRTADAAGFTAVISIKGTADFYSSKVIRAAAGSIFRINIKEFEKREDALKFLKKNDVELYACDGRAEVEYTEADLRKNICIVIGNEGNGVNRFFLKEARYLSIPMKEQAESLNAAVAAGIVIYESVRQRKNS